MVLVSPSSPSGLVTTPTCLPSTLQLRPQTSLNFTSFFFSFFAPFWLPLGLHFGSFWAPKLAQVRPKLPLDTLLFRKHAFSKKGAPPRARARFWTSKRPKIGPRWLQDRFKTISKSVFFRLRFCLRFWFVLGRILGAMLGPFLEPVGRPSTALLS